MGFSGEFRDWLSGRQNGNRSAGVVHQCVFRINAHGFINGRQQILITDGAVLRMLTLVIGGANNLAHRQSAAADQRTAGRSPVFPAGTSFVHMDARCAAKLAHHHQQHIVLQTAIVQILNEGTHGLVELRAAFLHDGKNVAVDRVIIPANHRAVIVASSIR